MNSLKKGCLNSIPFLFLLVLISFLFFASCSLPIEQKTELSNVIINKIIDGDSIELKDGRKIRYKGINAPEKNQFGYTEALSLNKSLLSGKKIHIEFDSEEKDQFGRSLAYVFADDLFVNQEILKSGWAITYLEQKVEIDQYKEMFVLAQKTAQQNQKGLWLRSIHKVSINHINFNAKGEDTKNINGEWVDIKNESNKPINLDNFQLKDESNNLYIFQDINLHPNSTIRLYSGKGTNTLKELYWGNNHPIWNNDSDKALLFDANNRMVDYRFYP